MGQRDHSRPRRAPHGEWIADVKRRSIAQVAPALGIERRGRDSYGPCPACGADRRGSQDRRGPIGARGYGWRCWASGCDARGSGIDLIAWIEIGRPPRRGDPGDWSRIHARAYQIGATAEAPTAEAPLPPPRPLPRAAPPAPRPYPESARLAELLSYGTWAATDSESGRRWLEETIPTYRPGSDLPRHLVRILPTRREIVDRYGIRAVKGAPRLPSWARWRGRSWVDAGYRILIPLYDCRGRVRSVRARHIAGANRPSGAPKGVSPAGRSVAGLVFSNGWGAEALAGRHSPHSVYLVEGGTDCLAASIASDPLERRAIYGVISGGWTPEHGARLAAMCSDATRITIDTDPDPAGDTYADRIAETIPAAVDVRRHRDPRGDLCDRLRGVTRA